MKTSILLLAILLFFTSCSKQKTKPLHTLVLSDKGVSTLTSSTPFLENIIAPKLMGYDIELFSAFDAGNVQSIMRVTHYDEEVMLLFPTQSKKEQESTLESITITSNLVQHPFDIQIGENYRSELDLICEKNLDAMRCNANDYKHIQLIFIPKDTTKWQLQEILWNKDALH
ncbi:MAG: hypothetical protein RBR54_06890 [Sulfurimonas sp.]|jgi:hypothetical protein|nr:hypothetical protein [Sulfurimonas sp.]